MNYLLTIFFVNVFLHRKIPRIAIQAKEMNVETSPTMGRGANPTYATPTPAITVAAPAIIPTAPIHLLRRALFTIATPKISATRPCRIRL
jgi:hypothetical protein